MRILSTTYTTYKDSKWSIFNVLWNTVLVIMYAKAAILWYCEYHVGIIPKGGVHLENKYVKAEMDGLCLKINW